MNFLKSISVKTKCLLFKTSGNTITKDFQFIFEVQTIKLIHAVAELNLTVIFHFIFYQKNRILFVAGSVRTDRERKSKKEEKSLQI